ncbi:MAG: nucleotidyl transferase AbiEii/AbiGii toxin family protein [Rhodocyclaceae bacterium]|nr:nucleotidyl transferase AbiEii/AbiGii toxin family protein [Rhodocyclaceae bacterium]MDP3030957.1 nucleotidyl transferase AbiEii/AbiGii toxin family protein [Rhodocyclaceae bacterium]
MGNEEIYPLQEAVLLRLQSLSHPQLSVAKLCGGTALSRCWLGHRVSFDLAFFLPEGFKAGELAVAMKNAGIDFRTKDIVDDLKKANQLHGYASHEGRLLKVSFVEDAYFTLFPAVEKSFGGGLVRTEEIPGLYHRKLRTVAGQGSEGDSFEGGRQTARDLFDLYVLSQAFKPLAEFIESLPYAFPSAAFNNGLASMPWYDLADELGEIICADEWAHAKDVAFLQNALYGQIGAVLVDDAWEDAPKPDPNTAPVGARPGKRQTKPRGLKP